MGDFIFIVVALAALVVAALCFHWYRSLRAGMQRVLHLITALSERQYTRRSYASERGPPGDLARAANSLAEMLEGRSAKAQLDSDHLLSLLAVLDHTNEIALATDSTDNIRLANPAAARVLGRPVDDLLGKRLDEVIVHQELLALYRSAFHATKPISAHVTLQAARDGARAIHCQATAATIYNGAHYRGTLLLLRDITEIARTLEIKTDFVANASHELRTPLAAILAAVETVKESSGAGGNGAECAEGDETGKCIDIIHRHARRLEMIITDLLDLSRAEDPSAAVRTETLDIGHVCEQVIGLFTGAAAEKHVLIRVDLASDARTMKGDARLLYLTLKNLLDNAVKFTNAGTITIRSYLADEPAMTQFEFDKPGGSLSGGLRTETVKALIVEVEDTGCGIPAEDQQRVFERFYTVNRSRGGADRGTGLGLAIVKHAVAAMGGRVSLESEPGKGTILRCHFPQVAPVVAV
jgi:two-component system phosphate regulon sensor histidine kinase PhoR